MKAASYVRVSTEGQATEGVSLQAQTDAIRRYAEYKGFELVHEIEDAGISGGLNKAREGASQQKGIRSVSPTPAPTLE